LKGFIQSGTNFNAVHNQGKLIYAVFGEKYNQQLTVIKACVTRAIEHYHV